jgi:hypothetical protein
LAASAGPEVGVAQSYGFTDVHAIDIAAEIGDLVAERYADNELNPYTTGNTVRIKADGRAAILHADAPFDIIQMVHANLHSSAGLMANAWSSSLLSTKEAFGTYLDNLSEDGTISFGRGSHTGNLARSAAAALRERGVEDPWTHIAFVSDKRGRMILVKKRPWTKQERDKLVRVLRPGSKKNFLYMDPVKPYQKRAELIEARASVMTDDRPYLDKEGLFTNAVKRFFSGKEPEYNDKGKRKNPDGYLGRVYDMLIIQCVFALLGGVLFLFVPLASRGRAKLKKLTGVPWLLLYVACLGYGYLAIETVLIHELVLFVGHPTYAVTVVILAMLASSGAGSVFAGRVKPERIRRTLAIVLGLIIVLGSVQAWVVPDLLKSFALGYPPIVRMILTGLILTPLGFVMGFPFPLGLRQLPERASAAVPWAWALNGWMSVVASICTVLLSRNYGYSYAFAVALGVYVLALGFSLRLVVVGREKGA